MISKVHALRALGASMVALAVVPWLSVTGASAGDKGGSAPNHKVTICHRTDSNTNPYVIITVDTDAAGGGQDKGVGDHSHKHLGAVWTASLKASHTKWGDIIPPYTDDQGVSFPGLNWTTQGQAIYNNGCRAVTTVTSSAPVTTSSSAPVTRSSSAPVTTSSSAAATSTSAAATTTGASVLPTKIGTTTAATSAEVSVEATQAQSLPKTGGSLPLGVAVGLSLGLLLAGAALLLLPGRLAVERNRRH